MEICEAHGQMIEDVTEIKICVKAIDVRINSSIDAIKKHIEDGEQWRKAIVGVIFAGIIQVVGFAYLFGGLNQKVNHQGDQIYRNTQIIDKPILKADLK